MRLEALKFIKRRKIRIFIIEMHHEADRNEIVAVVIKERASAGAAIKWPAEGMLHQPGLMLFRRDLPQLLQSDAEFLRLAFAPECIALQQSLGEIAARAFG